MKVRARVTASFAEPEDEQDRPPVVVDVRGDDLSILIGPKAETLNALQYITSLIVGKEIGRSAPLIVDVEGYRARRSPADPPASPADGGTSRAHRPPPDLWSRCRPTNAAWCISSCATIRM